MTDITKISTEELLRMRNDIQNVPTEELLKMRNLGGISSVPVSEIEQQEAQKQQWLQEQLAAGKLEPAKPSFWQGFKEDIPQMVGGTAGGIAGAKAGAMAGARMPGHPLLKGAATVAGGVGGAFLGGMGGKGYQQFYRITRPGATPKTLKELYHEQLIAGIEEGASELAGFGIAKVGGKVLAPVKKRLLPGAKQLNKQLLKRGAHLTPAQMTESRIIDTLEGMSEKSFFGGAKLQRLKVLQQPEALKRYVDDIVKNIARGSKTQLSPEEIGDLILDSITGKKLAFREATKAAYGKVDKLSKGVEVPLDGLKSFARKQMETAATRRGIGSSQAGDTLLKKVLQLDDTISFKQAHALRSAIMDEQRAMSMTKDKALGLTKKFISLTDEAMDSGARGLDNAQAKEALKAWRDANRFYKYGGAIKGEIIPGMTEFDTKLVRSLSKSLAENPEVAVRKIFRPGASKQVKLIRKFLNKNQWNTIRTAYIEDLIRKSADVDGVVLGNSFLRNMNKMGDDTLKEIFSNRELTSIQSIGRLAEIMQKPTGGSGGMVIQLMQAGAAVNLLTRGIPELTEESGTILIGPPVLSYMLTRPKFAKYLSEGFRTPRSSPQVAAVAVRVIRAVKEAKKEMNQQKEIKTPSRELRGFGGRGY